MTRASIPWRRLCGVLLATALSNAVASAANIAWVSFHQDANMASAGAMGATPPHTVAPDKAYTDLLTANGHTVTRVLTTDNAPAAHIAALNTYDLVIIGRSVNSGHYQTDTETVAYHSITAPMIISSGYLLRTNRLGFTSGNTIPDTFVSGTSTDVRLTVNNTSHPIFAGVALDGSNTMVNPFASLVTFSGSEQRGISVNTDAVNPGGVVLATVGTAGDPAFGGMMIGHWSPGAVMVNDGVDDMLAGHRLVFLTGSRESATAGSSEVAGLFDLGPDGERLFLNAVNFMLAIPEPSSAVLCSLMALALLRRKSSR
jgi:hypothetical protein